MSAQTEENKAIVRRFQEGIWQGNVALVDELTTEIPLGGTASREEWKANVLGARSLMPDLKYTIEEMIAEGDKVVVRSTITGTHSNDFPTPFGIAKPTGKLIKFSAITIHRLENGKIVEDIFENNNLEFYQQLGVLPAKEG